MPKYKKPMEALEYLINAPNLLKTKLERSTPKKPENENAAEQVGEKSTNAKELEGKLLSIAWTISDSLDRLKRGLGGRVLPCGMTAEEVAQWAEVIGMSQEALDANNAIRRASEELKDAMDDMSDALDNLSQVVLSEKKKEEEKELTPEEIHALPEAEMKAYVRKKKEKDIRQEAAEKLKKVIDRMAETNKGMTKQSKQFSELRKSSEALYREIIHNGIGEHNAKKVVQLVMGVTKAKDEYDDHCKRHRRDDAIRKERANCAFELAKVVLPVNALPEILSAWEELRKKAQEAEKAKLQQKQEHASGGRKKTAELEEVDKAFPKHADNALLPK